MRREVISGKSYPGPWIPYSWKGNSPLCVFSAVQLKRSCTVCTFRYKPLLPKLNLAPHGRIHSQRKPITGQGVNGDEEPRYVVTFNEIIIFKGYFI